ncbi:MAG: T9SS type A sorting domain-containing protein [Rhizobacter sp.]|nr:T9SS type A sorting domain-containing protein [Ferruginibacter sp.]
MKKITHFFVVTGFVIGLASCAGNKVNTQVSKKKSKEQTIKEAFMQEFYKTRDMSTNTVPAERLFTAIARQKQIFAQQAEQRAVGGLGWEERGPINVGGRIRAMIFDKNDATNKKVWIGGVGGGLWYTNDISQPQPVWIKVNDFLDNISISALVQSAANPQIIYAATGEGFLNADAQRGLGIWKTIDGGSTWAQLPSTTAFRYVTDITYDQNGKLYAGVRGASAAVSGVFRSADEGATWTNVFNTAGGGASNSNPADFSVSASGDIYVAMGIYGNNGGIYTSPAGVTAGDAGTWTNITPNGTGIISAPANFWQRIKLATAPSDNNILYAVFQGWASDNATSIQQYNKSTNTWSVKTVPTIIDQGSNSNFTRGQAWYDLVATVDPNDANTLVIGGVDALKSTNAGTNWTQITTWSLFLATGYTSNQNVHADHHEFLYAPGSSSVGIYATDGGVYYSSNMNTPIGFPTALNRNNGLNITQYYATAIHPTAGTNYFLAGAQDNGSQKFSSTGLNSTTNASGGDGAFCHISPLDPNNQITSFIYNNYYVSTNAGANFTPRSKANTGQFINPTDYDGNNLYGGASSGAFSRWLSPQTNGAYTSNAFFPVLGGAVYNVTISPITPNRVYFGMSSGLVAYVNDAHILADQITVGVPRAGSVSSISFDPVNENKMLVSYSNYGGGKLYLTTNALSGAATFTNITGNLPDMPVRWAMFDPRSSNMVIIATELGVWSCDDITAATPQWNTSNNGLANARVDMLKYRSSDRTIVAATHGRGLFTSKLPDNLNPEINFFVPVKSHAELPSFTDAVNCRKYTDYDVMIGINGPPSANATVDLAVNAGATATEGADFDYTTNGVFGAGSSKTLSFLAGINDGKTFKLRVYDDAVVESPGETFTLSFTTSGGGSSIGTIAPTETITIIDNDAAITNTTPIATTVNDTDQKQVKANSDLNKFQNATGQLISLVGPSSQELGCVTAKIEAAGVGFVPFASGQRSNKVWAITPTTNGATATYTLRLYMTNAELNGTPPVNYKIYKSTATTVAGITSGNTQTVATTVLTDINYTSFTASFTGFSLFFIGSENVVLPLQLLQFSGVRNNGISKIFWKTDNEVNTKNFIVERSKDGVVYQSMGTVNAAGTGSGTYNFDDAIKFGGNMYYRLKMTDIDGSFTRSSVIVLKETPENKVNIYPNPFQETFTIDIGATSLLNTLANIIDAKAVVLKTIKLTAMQTQVNVSGMAKGNYVVQFADGNSMKIVKK